MFEFLNNTNHYFIFDAFFLSLIKITPFNINYANSLIDTNNDSNISSTSGHPYLFQIALYYNHSVQPAAFPTTLKLSVCLTKNSLYL